jgi:hypothetical protein
MGRAPRWSALLGGRQSTGLRGSRIEVEAEPRGLLILSAAAADDAPCPAHAPLVSATGSERARLAQGQKQKTGIEWRVICDGVSDAGETCGFRPRHMLRIGSCGSETTCAPHPDPSVLEAVASSSALGRVTSSRRGQGRMRAG